MHPVSKASSLKKTRWTEDVPSHSSNRHFLQHTVLRNDSIVVLLVQGFLDAIGGSFLQQAAAKKSWGNDSATLGGIFAHLQKEAVVDLAWAIFGPRAGSPQRWNLKSSRWRLVAWFFHTSKTESLKKTNSIPWIFWVQIVQTLSSWDPQLSSTSLRTTAILRCGDGSQEGQVISWDESEQMRGVDLLGIDEGAQLSSFSVVEINSQRSSRQTKQFAMSPNHQEVDLQVASAGFVHLELLENWLNETRDADIFWKQDEAVLPTGAIPCTLSRSEAVALGRFEVLLGATPSLVH